MPRIRCFVLCTVIIAAVAASLAQEQSAEDQCLGVLASQRPVAEKAAACRELKAAGTEKSVPALAALLADKELSHSARIALESMPYASAGAALRDALGRASGLTRSGVIDSIGERRDAAAVPLLAPLLADKDLQVVAAAAIALGKIGTADAAAALAWAQLKASGDARTRIADGLITAAHRLLSTGNRSEAANIYRALSGPGESRTIRAAALCGQVCAAGDQAAERVKEFLASDDAAQRAAGAGGLPLVTATDLHIVAAGMKTMPAASQIAVLMAIRIRGDQSFSPMALEAARGKDEAVAIAAVRALGTAGDAAALPLLLQLSGGEGQLAAAAKSALEAVGGATIAERIAAVPLLLKEALSDDAAVRSRAVAALRRLARPEDVPGLIAAVLKAEKGPERDSAEKAVMLVCRQIADTRKQADPVFEALRIASPADKAALLPMLGRIGGPKAMEMIQSALGSTDAQLYEAGVRALSNWPDASVADQLLKLSQTAKDENHRLWALRAFIRVIALPDKTPDAAKLGQLKQAMQLSQRDEERALILDRAAAVRSVETLHFVLPYLDQPPLAEQACKTVTALAHHRELRAPNKKEFGPALERVIKTSRDRATLEQARQYLQAM